MKIHRGIIIVGVLALAGLVMLLSVNTVAALGDEQDKQEKKAGEKQMSDKEWKEKLTPEQYRVLRQKGTERAFSGIFDEHFEPGVYVCAGCDNKLFESTTKYNSGCGWPAFNDVPADAIKTIKDTSLGMVRTEVVCAECDGHLGHVFRDGPPPTGLRYCINSASLKFIPQAEWDARK